MSTSDKETYDFNTGSGKYDNLNLLLTNEFENTFLAIPKLRHFRVQEKKYNYQLGLAVQQSIWKVKVILPVPVKILCRANYTNYFPTANFNFTLQKVKSPFPV